MQRDSHQELHSREPGCPKAQKTGVTELLTKFLLHHQNRCYGGDLAIDIFISY